MNALTGIITMRLRKYMSNENYAVTACDYFSSLGLTRSARSLSLFSLSLCTLVESRCKIQIFSTALLQTIQYAIHDRHAKCRASATTHTHTHTRSEQNNITSCNDCKMKSISIFLCSLPACLPLGYIFLDQIQSGIFAIHYDSFIQFLSHFFQFSFTPFLVVHCENQLK